MTYRIPNALRPEPDESLLGLIMRTSARYRFMDPARVLHRLQPPKVALGVLCRTEPSGRLAPAMQHALGLSDEQWARLAMGTGDEDTVRVNGHVMSRGQARVGSRFVCPACLAQSPHHRAVWLLDALPVCAVHGTRLISACPDCDLPLRWGGPGPHLCSSRPCRFDLRKAAPEKLPDEELEGVRALARLFHCDDPAAEAPLGLPFGELLRLCVVLGYFANGIERVCHVARSTRVQRENLHRFVNDGWRVLGDWPTNFHRFLDVLKGRSDQRRGKGGMFKTFGPFSSNVFQWSREPWGAPIGTAFANYAGALDDLPVTSTKIARYGTSEAVDQRNMSISEAAKSLEIGLVSLQRLVTRRNLYALAPAGPGVASLVKAEEVLRLDEELKSYLLPDEARVLLNVGRKVFDKLEAAGSIARVQEDARVMVSRPFLRSTLEEFIAACRGAPPSISDREARDRGLWTLASSTAPGREPPDVCRALVEGRLRAVALVKGQHGLKGMRLLPEDVERVLPFKRVTMSAVEVGRLLGVNYEHVLHWVRRGLMGTVPPGGPDEFGMRFSQGTVDAFRAEFILGGELARMDADCVRPNGAMTRHLKFLGVPMVSGHAAGDGGKVAVFRRSDVTPEVLAQVGRVRTKKVMPTQELRQRGYDRVAMAAAVIGQRWGAQLRRVNNRFTDDATGRTVQVVSGRRPDMTGVFLFNVQRESLGLLRLIDDAWVALVPNHGDTFLLMPIGEVRWRGTGVAHHITVNFDARGQPTEMAHFAVPLLVPMEAA